MKSYNGFDGATRQRVHTWLKGEVEAGRVQWPTVCAACGQTKGVIDAHHEDYNQPLAFVGLCYICHLMLHCRFKQPQAWERYKAAIRSGVRYAPAFRRDFGIITALLEGHKREHTCHKPPVRDVFAEMGL